LTLQVGASGVAAIDRITLPIYLDDPQSVPEVLEELPKKLVGHRVVFVGRLLLSGSKASAERLLQEVIVDRKADEVTVTGVPDSFRHELEIAAKDLDVSPRLNFEAAGTQ
jgi:hypothetical protein